MNTENKKVFYVDTYNTFSVKEIDVVIVTDNENKESIVVYENKGKLICAKNTIDGGAVLDSYALFSTKEKAIKSLIELLKYAIDKQDFDEDDQEWQISYNERCKYALMYFQAEYNSITKE